MVRVKTSNRWNKLEYGVKDTSFRCNGHTYKLSQFMRIVTPWADYSAVSEYIKREKNVEICGYSPELDAAIEINHTGEAVKIYFLS